MNKRHALTLSAVLAATVLTGGAAILGMARTPPNLQAASPVVVQAASRRRSTGRRETDAPHLGRRPLRLGDARDRRGARLVAPAACRLRRSPLPRRRSSSRARTANRSSSSCSPAQPAPRTRRPRRSGVVAMSFRLERTTFRAVGHDLRARGDGGAGRRATRSRGARRGAGRGRGVRGGALSLRPGERPLAPERRRAGDWTAVDERLVEALRLAVRAREETGGRFDPTILPALVAAGYDRSFEQLEERPARRARGLARRRGDRGRRGRRCACDSSREPPSISAASARATRPRARWTRCAHAWPLLPGRPRRPRRRPRARRRAARGRPVAGRRRRPESSRHAAPASCSCARAASRHRAATSAASGPSARSTT